MNRVAPSFGRLIVPPSGVAARRVRPAPAPAWAAPQAPSSNLLDDLKLFATGWIGGLIFFGTLLS